MMMNRILAAICAAALLFALCTGAFADVEAGVYNSSLLINWTDEAFQTAFGVSAADFVPADPQPKMYIVTCEPVIDPRTKREVETGRSYGHLTEPSSTEEVLSEISDLKWFGLTLTDDPNQATYRVVISFKYKKGGTFHHSDGHKTPEYNADQTVTMINMITGERAVSTEICYALYVGASYETRLLAEGIGRQFFARPSRLYPEETPDFNELLGLGADVLFDFADEEDGVCIVRYLGSSQDTLKIPSTFNGKPVTGIGERVFAGYRFKAVQLPSTLTHIDAEAFFGCGELTTINLPPSLISIGNAAFEYIAVQEIEIPDSTAVLGTYVFAGCDALTKIKLPTGLTEIPEGMLVDTAVSSVSIPDTVTVIGKEAFKYCKKLKSIRIPASVQSIGDGAFSGCTALTEVMCEENSYAQTWAEENNVSYKVVLPPTEEELMEMRYPTLKKGSKGDAVKQLQQALIDLGYLNGAADGSYGPATAKAVSAAQEAFGMKQNGIASGMLQAKLFGDDSL